MNDSVTAKGRQKLPLCPIKKRLKKTHVATENHMRHCIDPPPINWVLVARGASQQLNTFRSNLKIDSHP